MFASVQMASRTSSNGNINNELQNIKRQLHAIAKEKIEGNRLIESGYGKETSSNESFTTLVKYMVEENKRTTLLLKSMSDSLERMENALLDIMEGGEQKEARPVHAEKAELQQENMQQPDASIRIRELPVSELDKRILQFIQIHNMACADDLKAAMKYKGRNAASAHLNRLHKMGLIERYQLGHKVYYKFDPGKTASTLIVSPP